MSISDEPDYCCAAPLTNDELQKYFGTSKPTKSQIKENSDFWYDLDRGMARYVIIYDQDKPKEIFFGGYSFD